MIPCACGLLHTRAGFRALRFTGWLQMTEFTLVEARECACGEMISIQRPTLDVVRELAVAAKTGSDLERQLRASQLVELAAQVTP